MTSLSATRHLWDSRSRRGKVKSHPWSQTISPSGLNGHTLMWSARQPIIETVVHPTDSKSHLIMSRLRRLRNGMETVTRSFLWRVFLSKGHVLTFTGIQFSIHLLQKVWPHGPWTGDSNTPRHIEQRNSSSGWLTKRSTSYPIAKWSWMRTRALECNRRPLLDPE